MEERPIELLEKTDTAAGKLPVSFGLQSLMLLVTLCGIAAALFKAFPPVGPFFFVISALAFLRTAQGVRQAHTTGAVIGAMEKIGMFLQSLAIVSILMVAGGATAAGVCLPLAAFLHQLFDLAGVWLSVAISIYIAGCVTYVLCRRIWPWKT